MILKMVQCLDFPEEVGNFDNYDNEKVYQDYLNNLEKNSKKIKKDKNDINLKYVSITTLMNRFKVYNGKDVLNVLLTSERLFLI